MLRSIAQSAFMVSALTACGTFYSHDGPHADAPRFYSGVRLDWATLTGDTHYVQRYELRKPYCPVADLPLSFGADSLILPLTLQREIYQWLAVPKEGW